MSATVNAPAKLTISLRVTGLRPDGFHLIDAEMVTLNLCDTLTITEAETSSLSVSGPFAEGVPIDSSNLCLAAAEFARRPASIRLEKNIPHGGSRRGSADAAAVLRWAGISDVASTVTLGADIPFCLHGGRARVTGIGENIEPLPYLDRTFTLVAPPLHVVLLRSIERGMNLAGRPVRVRMTSNQLLCMLSRNSTGGEQIMSLTGLVPVLAGSGATWVEGERDDALVELIGEGAVVRVVRTSKAM